MLSNFSKYLFTNPFLVMRTESSSLLGESMLQNQREFFHQSFAVCRNKESKFTNIWAKYYKKVYWQINNVHFETYRVLKKNLFPLTLFPPHPTPVQIHKIQSPLLRNHSYQGFSILSPKQVNSILHSQQYTLPSSCNFIFSQFSSKIKRCLAWKVSCILM